MAQEILGTFVDEVGQVALEPSCEAGLFRIHVDGGLLWCRKSEGGFPDVKALKKRIRDKIAPDRELGHLDN